MIVATVYSDSKKEKWEIIKNGENSYDVEYFEYFNEIGWKSYGISDKNCTKDLIEWDFEIKIA